MRLSNVAALLALVPAALLTTGCMGELDDQGAMYPEPVGYTTTPRADASVCPACANRSEAHTVEIGDVGRRRRRIRTATWRSARRAMITPTPIRAPSPTSEARSTRTARGSTTRRTAPSGFRPPARSAPTSSPYVSGGALGVRRRLTPGCPTIRGGGRRSTTAAGHTWAARGGGWIPGRTYAEAAWVSWRRPATTTGGTSGGAPLPPTYYWRGGYAYGLGVVPYAPYAFCASGVSFSARASPGHIVTRQSRSASSPRTRGRSSSASPGVGGTAGAGGHVAARPNVEAEEGPSSLGIASASVAHAPGDNHGLAQARAFAHPNTAASLGARPPAQSAAARSFAQNNRAAAPANTRSSPLRIERGARVA